MLCVERILFLRFMRLMYLLPFTLTKMTVVENRVSCNIADKKDTAEWERDILVRANLRDKCLGSVEFYPRRAFIIRSIAESTEIEASNCMTSVNKGIRTVYHTMEVPICSLMRAMKKWICLNHLLFSSLHTHLVP